MLPILLIAIFLRPFISAPTFPYLNFVYSMGCLTFLGVYLIYKKPALLNLKPVAYPVSFFILALGVSVIFSQNQANSLAELYKYITGIILFLIASSLAEKGKILVIRTIVLAGVVISLLAVYQYFFGFRRVLDYLSSNKLVFPFVLDYLQSKRVFLPFMTPGILGGYLAMVVPLLLISKNRAWFSLPVFFALFLSRSLGAFLSLFGALMIYFSLKDKLKKAHVFSLLGLFIAIVLIFIWRSAAQGQHLQPVFSTWMRLGYWQEALGVIKGHPWVGIGLGNLSLTLSRYAHNSYLQIWAEMGILGIFSFIWLVGDVLSYYFNGLKQPLPKNQNAALFAASMVFLMHNLLDFTFFLPEVVWIWWVILGLMLAPDHKSA